MPMPAGAYEVDLALCFALAGRRKFCGLTVGWRHALHDKKLGVGRQGKPSGRSRKKRVEEGNTDVKTHACRAWGVTASFKGALPIPRKFYPSAKFLLFFFVPWRF